MKEEMKKGIDVSQYNGSIDWEKVKEDGIVFAMLRAGFGQDMEKQDDKQICANMKECERLGIPFGLYLYSYALSEKDVQSEAKHLLRIAKGHNPLMGLWYDMEDADGYKANHGLVPARNGRLLTDFCKLFLEEMQAAGYTNTGIYANYDYLKNILNTDELRQKGNIWIAHWGVQDPSMDCLIWQYTSNGSVKGIVGHVDLDYYYGSLGMKECR